MDKKTALALWDSAVPTNVRKRRIDEKDEEEEEGSGTGPETMAFTVITKKGNKQQASLELYISRSYLIYTLDIVGQARQIAVPSASALAVHTRTAQLQDKVEQQHLKRLVLNYEQREEAEELKGTFGMYLDILIPWRFLEAMEARHRAGAIKIRYVG